jgi:hypothetical protein
MNRRGFIGAFAGLTAALATPLNLLTKKRANRIIDKPESNLEVLLSGGPKPKWPNAWKEAVEMDKRIRG